MGEAKQTVTKEITNLRNRKQYNTNITNIIMSGFN